MGARLASISVWLLGAPCDELCLPKAHALMAANVSTISTHGRPAIDGDSVFLHQ